MALKTGKSHISFSEVKDWHDCTYRHKLKYIDKIGEFVPGPALTFGTALHESCEDFLRTRVMKPELAFDIIKKDWANFSVKYPPEVGYTDESREQALLDAATILLEVPAFMDKTFPEWEFVAAEETLMEPIVGHDDVKFKGFIDGIVRCKGKRGETLQWIIDWKTTARGWFREKRSDFITHAQLILYKNYWTTREQASIKDTRCAFVLLKKAGKPGEHVELFSISVGPVALQKSLKVINNAVTGIKKGIAIKNRDSCRFCDYKDTPHCT